MIIPHIASRCKDAKNGDRTPTPHTVQTAPCRGRPVLWGNRIAQGMKQTKATKAFRAFRGLLCILQFKPPKQRHTVRGITSHYFTARQGI